MSSLFRLISSQNSMILRKTVSQSTAFVTHPRFLSVTGSSLCATKGETAAATASAVDAKTKDIDRTKIITLEQSLRYLASVAYQQTYGEKLVWEQYRRNHKGGLPPKRTRRTCVRKGMISTGNPCPICRDEYLLLDHRNLELLKQFISPHTGEVGNKLNSNWIQFLRTKCIYVLAIDSQLREDRALSNETPATGHRHRTGDGPGPHHIRRAIPPVQLRRIL